MPINNEKFLQKATTFNFDTICFDLEDGVSPTKKEEARSYIHKALNNYSYNKRSEICVRVNPCSTEYCIKDVNEILTSNILPNSICLPKCESSDDIKWLSNEINKICGKRGNSIEIIGMIESINAVYNSYNICSSDKRLTGIIFGGDDYAASINAIRTESNHELLYARHKVLFNCKVNNIDCIDIVNINLSDNNQIFMNEAIKGFEMGFVGKQVIHPKQAEWAQIAFTAKKEKIQWAVDIINEFDKQKDVGVGAFNLKGEMIDMPTVKIAQNIVDRAKSCGIIS